jgi:hypothetical protein
MAGKKKTETKSKSDKSHKAMKKDDAGMKGGEAKRDQNQNKDIVVDEFWVEEVTPDDEVF